MVLNPLILALSALVPTIVGFIYYNDNLFGKMWKRQVGINDGDPMPNMVVLTLVSVLFGFLASVTLTMIVVHSNGLFSMLADAPDMKDANSELSKNVAGLMTKYGGEFRTFKHGALHGILTAIFFVLPIIGISALYERRSWGYIGVSTLFWAICLAIMGGILCQFS